MTPRTTYRLQLHAGFRFADATALIPYLERLGITHLYCSPYLKARAGSTHGYDIIDHNAINPELGTGADYRTFVDTLRAHGMGHVLDFVPNHMGVGGDDNAWWLDLLTWGEDSHYADYFDVDWRPLRPELRGKVLLPFLGKQYGDVLDDGELRWEYRGGEGFALRYYEHLFPLAPPTYALVLEGADPPSLASFAPLFGALDGIADHLQRRETAATARRLLDETEGDHARALAAKLDAGRTTAEGKALLERVVDAQHWRPASWQVAAEEINYRRFFDINALGAVRMERANCFGDAHRLVLDLIERGDVDGLRLDHVDGLYDPIGYCDLLRSEAELLGRPIYLVVEKILALGQNLLSRWNVDGTTGYEFMNAVTGLAIDQRNEHAFDAVYRRFTGDHATFAEAAYEAKRFILETAMSAELNVLAMRLDRIAQRDAHTRDFTLGALRRVLVETIAAFPIYRTYVTGGAVEPADAMFIERAVATARARDTSSEGSTYAFLRAVLLTDAPDDDVRERYVEFAMKFQQLTAPITAKGVEDTAFYRSLRLVALNEVGGDPGRFGTSVDEFHRQNRLRAIRRPLAMTTTATHDMKRGEDVRARLAVLSEVPAEWRAALARWSRMNRPLRGRVDRLAEYLVYQTLLGSWPVELFDEKPPAGALRAFAERVEQYALKATREAKLHTSWTNPDPEYEAALSHFVRALLDPARSGTFQADVRGAARSLAATAVTNGLAQAVLRATAPGVPDTYQGCELWDLSLVDPDNRRPVDFAERDAALAELDAACDAAEDGARERLAARLLASWRDGRVKLYVLATLLRRRAAEDWPAGEYTPLEALGEKAQHVVAYARGALVIVVPRLPRTLSGERPPLGDVWADTTVALGAGGAARYRDVLTGRIVDSVDRDGRPMLRLADALTVLPVVVLEPFHGGDAKRDGSGFAS
ncbi:MAG TPA: malto-oligosyltrehalose synthase [Candidatus Baltobacteraceae bacterium]|nr:malto-oligosyltrehalose synthase [Candidatus Baltobacteraceae bacterium]